jgi:hypothetical protein
MTPLRLLVNSIVGGFLLFAWFNLSRGFFGGAYADAGFLAQYLACFVEALFVGWILVLVAPRVRTPAWRTILVGALGLFAALVCDLPRWNQGPESASWLLGRMAENVLGFTLVGTFLAWRMKP